MMAIATDVNVDIKYSEKRLNVFVLEILRETEW